MKGREMKIVREERQIKREKKFVVWKPLSSREKQGEGKCK